MLLDPNFPFKPRSSPFFYGWVIVFASMLGIVMSLPGQTNGVSVFNEPLMHATGLERTELALAYCLGTLVSGLNMTLGGRLLDRFGVRRLIVHSSVAMALVLT
ncbi:MAG: MFS transporter, partial [Planctomycetes bacterium]|nr:MFS transporter [Planctomycetota bacterium]